MQIYKQTLSAWISVKQCFEVKASLCCFSSQGSKKTIVIINSLLSPREHIYYLHARRLNWMLLDLLINQLPGIYLPFNLKALHVVQSSKSIYAKVKSDKRETFESLKEFHK